jgi:transposase
MYNLIMKGFHLTGSELAELRLAHRRARAFNAPAAYKINAVILLGTGWKVKDVMAALLIDDNTLRSYVGSYLEGGIELLTKNNYQGSECRLIDLELKKLCDELDGSIYLTTKSVIDYIQKTFNKTFSLS